jgi:TPR repeat protein
VNNIGCVWRDLGKIKLAISWFKKAVALGDDEANLNIAKVHIDKLHNPAAALPYLKFVCASEKVSEDAREESERLIKQFRKKLSPRKNR